jgi:DtxR family Mn-dependent transcriptional regulator
VISDDVEARLVELLGNPKTCPHGNPIPGAGPPDVDSADHSSLAEVSVGDVVRLERITEEVEVDTESLVFLYEHGFIPGETATVVGRESDESVVLDAGGPAFSVGRSLCSQLFVSTVRAA